MGRGNEAAGQSAVLLTAGAGNRALQRVHNFSTVNCFPFPPLHPLSHQILSLLIDIPIVPQLSTTTLILMPFTADAELDLLFPSEQIPVDVRKQLPADLHVRPDLDASVRLVR